MNIVTKILNSSDVDHNSKFYKRGYAELAGVSSGPEDTLNHSLFFNSNKHINRHGETPFRHFVVALPTLFLFCVGRRFLGDFFVGRS